MREQRYTKRSDGTTRIKWAVKKYRSPRWPPIRPSTPEDSADALMKVMTLLLQDEHLKVYGTMLMQMLVAQGLATETITDDFYPLRVVELAALIEKFKQHN
jgi:hypothetical protein